MTPEFVPLSEAARMLGLGVTTLRSWCQLGRVAAKKDSQAQWLINFESARAHVATAKQGATAGRRMTVKLRDGQRPENAHASSEGATGRGSEASAEALSIALESLNRERRQNDELRAQNKELQAELVRMTAEMRALLGKEGDGMLSRWFRR